MKQIISIQYLRAVAAAGVVVHHALGPPFVNNGFAAPTSIGEAGVDLFFVISGFIIWVTTGARALSPAEFVQHRVVRIVPLYWICTFAYLAMQLASRNTEAISLAALARSLLFIPTYDPQLAQKISAFYFLGWTLMYEMFFYALFAIVLLIPRPRQLASVIAALVCLSLLGAVVPFQGGMSYAYTSPLLLEFVVGCLLGALYLNGVLPGTAIGVLLAVIGAAALLGTEWRPPDGLYERTLFWGAPAALIVFGALCAENAVRRRASGLLVLLGDASYAIYLSHVLILLIFNLIVQRLKISVDFRALVALYLFVGGAIAIAGGVLVHRFIEKPVTAFLKSRQSRQGALGSGVWRAGIGKSDA
jgi:exopolysaccharide production protein ExoZ